MNNRVGPLFMVWTQGLRGHEPQLWSSRPQPKGISTDYWDEKNGRIISICEVKPEHMNHTFDELVTLYPGAAGLEPPVILEVERIAGATEFGMSG